MCYYFYTYFEWILKKKVVTLLYSTNLFTEWLCKTCLKSFVCSELHAQCCHLLRSFSLEISPIMMYGGTLLNLTLKSCVYCTKNLVERRSHNLKIILFLTASDVDYLKLGLAEKWPSGIGFSCFISSNKTCTVVCIQPLFQNEKIFWPDIMSDFQTCLY